MPVEADLISGIFWLERLEVNVLLISILLGGKRAEDYECYQNNWELMSVV